MSADICSGDKVRFKGHDAAQVAWGNCSETVGVLEPGQIYEVESVRVYSWHTKLRLVGFPGMGFNSCMFED